MGLMKRAELWYFKKMINGQRFIVSTGFADRKSAERRAVDIEHDIRAGIHGWKSTMPSFAEWWAIYKKTYTPTKSSRESRCANRHTLPSPLRRQAARRDHEVGRRSVSESAKDAHDRVAGPQDATADLGEHGPA